jgi:iron complex outermembrane recepter protein
LPIRLLKNLPFYCVFSTQINGRNREIIRALVYKNQTTMKIISNIYKFYQKALFVLLAIIFSSFISFSQAFLTGSVKERELNTPLAGASVYWQNTNIGTRTDQNGTFKIAQLSAENQLVISFIGFEKLVLSESDLQKNPELEFSLEKSTYQSDEVVVNATRANANSGMAFSNVTKEDLAKRNSGQDLPILLNFTPSLITTSDAGAGIGYTGLRIRGTDATRINVTVNGIPINDAESQGVYWVNMPDFASSVSSIQIQRGVGTSSNGAGAFGGTINIQSNEFTKEPYAEINSSAGSFNSFKNTIKIGSGLIGNHFTFDGRLSKISSDGFVDRAFSNLKSYYLSGAYFGKKSFFRLNAFSGAEKTYQSWNGIDEATLKTNRKFNSFTYENQTDNYQQDHYQFLTNHSLSNNWSLNANLHYTKGFGYYEEFKEDEKFSSYGLPDVIIGAETIKRTDLIRQKWLDNDFYGTTFSIDYQSFKKLSTSLGGGYNIYDGLHFGDIIWAKFAPEKGFRWYKNKTLKTDFNLYSKTNFQISDKINIYTDLQIRTVDLDMNGTANQLQDISQKHKYTFFNPKFGATANVSDKIQTYISFSIGQKEPNRTDFVDKDKLENPKAEKLQDLELGIKYNSGQGAFSINGFWMNYVDQLVVTGAINDVGNPIRTNIPKSLRAGIEIEYNYSFSTKLAWAANATFSKNKVSDFIELIPDYEGSNLIVNHKKADIAFSPNTILGSQLVFKPLKQLELALLSKYVGKQYLDNTSNESRKLNPYFTNDVRVLYDLKPTNFPKISLGLYLNNVLNEQYENNGYTYSYLYENQVTTENFYYPQAGRNFMVSASLKF